MTATNKARAAKKARRAFIATRNKREFIAQLNDVDGFRELFSTNNRRALKRMIAQYRRANKGAILSVQFTNINVFI